MFHDMGGLLLLLLVVPMIAYERTYEHELFLNLSSFFCCQTLDDELSAIVRGNNQLITEWGSG